MQMMKITIWVAMDSTNQQLNNFFSATWRAQSKRQKWRDWKKLSSTKPNMSLRDNVG